jgi:hypothetical protein
MTVDGRWVWIVLFCRLIDVVVENVWKIWGQDAFVENY